jgi:hypothetical protein
MRKKREKSCLGHPHYYRYSNSFNTAMAIQAVDRSVCLVFGSFSCFSAVDQTDCQLDQIQKVFFMNILFLILRVILDLHSAGGSALSSGFAKSRGGFFNCL